MRFGANIFCLPVLLLPGQVLVQDLPHLFVPRGGLFQKFRAGGGSGQAAFRAKERDRPVQLLFLGAVVRVQGQRHHERFVLVLAGQVNFQRETNDYGQPGNELGHPQADGGHQHQAVRAESLDPETARAVPDEVPQGDITIELPLFPVEVQQRKAHKAPDALIEERGVDGQVRVNDNAFLGRDRAAHEVVAGGLAVHAPGQGGIAAKSLLIEEVAPAAAALPDEEAHGRQVKHGQHGHAPPFAGQSAEQKAADDAAVDGKAAVPDGKHLPDAFIRKRSHGNVINPGAGNAQHHADKDHIHHGVRVHAEFLTVPERKHQRQTQAHRDADTVPVNVDASDGERYPVDREFQPQPGELYQIR